jgi:hypothetical protein
MSVILTEGSIPTLTKEQLKLRRLSYKVNSRRRNSQKSGPVTVTVFTTSSTPASAN